MNFRDLRYQRFNSAFARQALGLMFRPGRSYSVCFGPLRGLKLQYDRSINFHTILGLWDAETFRILNRLFVKDRLLPRNSTIADIGGNVGYYSMWFAKIAGARSVYTFEPNPDVFRILQANIELNRLKNVELVPEACGDHTGTTDFYVAPHHHSSSLHADWAGGGEVQHARRITVPLTTLDSFFANETGRPAPDLLKIDIEGGGTFALPGCRHLLAESRPFLLVESHTPDEDRAISNVLCGFDYSGYRLNDRKWVGKSGSTHPDREGVWGTLLLTPAEHKARVAMSLEAV
jgi:FkbM family methyltransferase